MWRPATSAYDWAVVASQIMREVYEAVAGSGAKFPGGQLTWLVWPAQCCSLCWLRSAPGDIERPAG